MNNIVVEHNVPLPDKAGRVRAGPQNIRGLNFLWAILFRSAEFYAA